MGVDGRMSFGDWGLVITIMIMIIMVDTRSNSRKDVSTNNLHTSREFGAA